MGMYTLKNMLYLVLTLDALEDQGLPLLGVVPKAETESAQDPAQEWEKIASALSRREEYLVSNI